MKKKMRQKTPKIVGKCQILPLLVFFWSKLQIQITNDLKLTILVVLWRACYREKAKKKSRCTKILSSETRTARIWIWIFALKNFFCQNQKISSKPSRTKQNRSSSQSLYIIITMGNIRDILLLVNCKRLYFFS